MKCRPAVHALPTKVVKALVYTLECAFHLVLLSKPISWRVSYYVAACYFMHHVGLLTICWSVSPEFGITLKWTYFY